MNTIRLSFLVVAALASSVALCQQAPDHTEAGITSTGLPLGQVRPMTVELAKKLVAVAKKEACVPGGGCSGAFAVVDDAGVLVYLETIDGVLAGGPDLAVTKAKASAIWRRPTAVFQEAVNNNTNTSYADGTFSNMTTSRGGVPLFKDKRIVGGFGMAAVGAGGKHILDAVAAETEKLLGKQ
jgi:uncharacterized protein GlcG (DUF336 family)